MVLEWKSSPPSPPSPVRRRFSVPTSLDRNLPIFFLLLLLFFFFFSPFPVSLLASSCLAAAGFLEVGISGCEKAETLTKEPPPTTCTELASAESAAWWSGGEPLEE